jgi:ABC-type branched-subunit amino acid transport system ATPase component/ABC-type branched-subunit amino acid transport system permease subunit
MRFDRSFWTWLSIAVVAVVLVAGVLGSLVSNYYTFLIGSVLVTAVSALGLNIVMGYAGQVSLGHAAFMAVGAYTTGLLYSELALPFVLAAIAGVLAATVIGVLLGVPALRLSPLYLAMVTFAFGEVVTVVAINWLTVTGGPNGLRIPPVALGNSGMTLPMFVVFAGILAILAFLLGRNLLRGALGRALRALRESPLAAEAIGINVARHKVIAFALSAAYGGLAGALYLGLVQFINPDAFGFPTSLLYVTLNVVGGMGSILGSIIGTVIFVALPEVVSGFAEYSALISAALLLAFLLFVPRGIVGSIEFAIARRRSADRVVAVETSAAAAHLVLPVEGPAASIDPVGASPTPILAAAHKPLLEITDLSIAFGGVSALSSVNLTVGEGEIHALIGPNGSGKTTLINVLSGIYQPQQGVVRLNGRDITRQPAHRRAKLGIGRTFQNLQLFGEMTVLENVLAGGDARARVNPVASALWVGPAAAHEATARQTALALLAEVGLEPYADRLAASLPFGFQRLLEVARALAMDPRVLLLDEPGAGLTSAELEQLATVLADVRRRRGTSMLLVGHTIQLVVGLSDAATALDHGVVIASGTPESVMAAEAVVTAYLGEADDTVA